MEKARKTAAAVAAVFAYIRNQEEAVAVGAGSGDMMAALPDAAPVACSCWGMSGRRDIMQLRNLMQLRTFQKGPIR